MNVIDVPVTQIDIGERRRIEYGDLGALAQGMKRVGLLEPIVVDTNGDRGRYRLVAGERRLRAAKMLQWRTIPANLRDHLTPDELRDVELEENENRKPLSQRERERTFASAKHLVETAKRAAEVISSKSLTKSPGPGRPAQAGSTRQAAEALGISRQTVNNAQHQVAVSEQVPFLQNWKQADVLRFEQHLHKLAPDEQATLCNFIEHEHPMEPPKPHQAIPIAEVMAAKTPTARTQIYELAKSADKRERDLASTRAVQAPPMPDQRITLLREATGWLRKALQPPYDKDAEVDDIRRLHDGVKAVLKAMEQRYEQRKREEEARVESDIRTA